MKKNNRINLKSQRGAATALVVFTVLMFITILIGVYGIVVARAQSQLKSDARIQDIYGKEVERANEIYEEIASTLNDSEAPTVTITMTNSPDYLFAIKSVITVADNKELDYNNCKYIYTNTDTPLGDDISSYTEGNITGETTTVEKAKGAGTYYLHVLATDTSGNTTEEISDTAITIADIQNYSYTGAAQEANLMAGNYKFECWGAQGGNAKYKTQYNGGLGGYTSGNINLNNNTNLYIYVGGMGVSHSGTSTDTITYNGNGYNGGNQGNFYSNNSNGGGGGGATDIRITNGNWDLFDSLKTRVMVAGGGGGADSHTSAPSWSGNGGAGGGLNGYDCDKKGTYYNYGTGGTQIKGGSSIQNSSYSTIATSVTGAFGIGGQIMHSGGGSGYYGGGCATHTSAGGGSSFISGHAGCNAIAQSSTSNSITHTGQANHYSGLVFTETKMIDGAGYRWTTAKGSLEQMPNPSGGYYASSVGHSGNGAARITNMN